jgi:hypothetical protein
MSVNMVALSWDTESEVELLAHGFEKMEVWVKYYPTFPPTEIGEARGDAEIWRLRQRPRVTPYQFTTASYWEGRKKVGIVQVLITLRPDTQEVFEKMGFKKTPVFAKRGAGGPTAEATPEDEQEFLTMEHPPTRWYAKSYWGAGADY